MNYEFLKRLFTACSDEEDGKYMDGLNLSELYERLEDVATATHFFYEATEKAALAHAVEDDLAGAAFDLDHAYELQGFVNGFRLCARMGRELYGEEDQA